MSSKKISLKSFGYTFQELINGLQNKTYQNLVFLTGAGISVSTGMPDFRSNAGLYEIVGKKFGQKDPTQIASIKMFRKSPELYYSLMKMRYEFNSNPQPTPCHKFFKACQDKEFDIKIFTQNVDSLEIDAGVHEKNLFQAHGHRRTATCINASCGKKFMEQQVKEKFQKDEVQYCDQCDYPVKPDVVLFGESLPSSFFENLHYVSKANLVFVMGTSMAVSPFNQILKLKKKNVPVVLMNLEQSLEIQNNGIDNVLWVQGDIDTGVKEIINNLSWKIN